MLVGQVFQNAKLIQKIQYRSWQNLCKVFSIACQPSENSLQSSQRWYSDCSNRYGKTKT